MTLNDIFEKHRTSSNFAQLVDTHCGYQSSNEIVEAIGEVATSAAEFDKIWQEPTEEQAAAVVARAFELAGPDEDELYWGIETANRP